MNIAISPNPHLPIALLSSWKVHALQLAAEEAYTQPKPDANNTTKPRPRVIIVEGLLLLGADEGAQLVRDEVCNDSTVTRLVFV